jgi:hypothetical protein
LVVALPLRFAMNWLLIWIGVVVRKPETTQIAGILVTFPLMLGKSLFVAAILAAVSVVGTTAAHRRIDR